MTARFASAFGPWRRTGRCRAMSRWRSPRPATPPPSPGPRPGRSIRRGRATRPIAATMPASTPNSAEYFEVLAAAEPTGAGRGEAIVNDAVQQSNLGYYGEADALFERAAQAGGGDMVVARMLRNYRAIDLLNRGSAADALTELDKPLPPSAALPPPDPASAIDARTAARVNAESPALRQLGGPGGALLPEERAQILDAQALHLRGTLLRLAGRPEPASAALQRALAQLLTVRDGRVTSTIWLRAQIYGEIAALAEARGDNSEAERQHQAAIALLEAGYPGSAALLGAQTRLAAHYARSGRSAEARALYRQVVDSNADGGSPSPTLHRSAGALFRLARAREERPGGGGRDVQGEPAPHPARSRPDPGRARARAFGGQRRGFAAVPPVARPDPRRSSGLRVEIGAPGRPRPTAGPRPASPPFAPSLPGSSRPRSRPSRSSPTFRATGSCPAGLMELAELQQALRPGEAYYKMIVVGDEAYAVLATPGDAQAWRIGASPAQLERQVDALRATIAVEEDGKILTYPFDVERAFALYGQLFGPGAPTMEYRRAPDFRARRRDAPASAQFAGHRSLRESTPISPRPRRPGDDGFDFTSVRWLGRDRNVSTAVSARAFRDVRQVAASRAAKPYLGFRRERAAARAPRSEQRRCAACSAKRPGCGWPLGQWAKPISAAELLTARKAVGAGADPTSSPAPAFSDSAIKARGDLVAISDPPFRHPRAGHRAAPRMPGPAGADDLVRGRRFGRAAQLQRDLRPSDRRRPRHPLRLRHRRQGEPRRHPRGRSSRPAANSLSTGWCAPSSAPAAAR